MTKLYAYDPSSVYYRFVSAMRDPTFSNKSKYVCQMFVILINNAKLPQACLCKFVLVSVPYPAGYEQGTRGGSGTRT